MSSLGPLGGIPASAAGAPLSQSQGTDRQRAAQDTASAQRESQTAENAEEAAGIGQTDEDQEASERDADGRKLWEAAPEAADNNEEETNDSSPPAEPKLSKDVTGESGNQLDLSG